MTNVCDFFRFPHTPHLAWLGQGRPRDDKVLSHAEAEAILREPVVVEEKLDGANVGISIATDGTLKLQNRGQYLLPPYGGQFVRLMPWLQAREAALFDGLDPHLILFGEWCAARHSLAYTALPDWWLLFDIYDREAGRFWSARRRDDWAQRFGFQLVPYVSRGRTNLGDLIRHLENDSSCFRAGPMEGIVVRQDDAEWSIRRSKLVRADFTQSIAEHWRQRSIEWNRLKSLS